MKTILKQTLRTKNEKCRTLFLIIFLLLTILAKSQVTVQLFHPPPNQWRIEELWNLILTNTTNNEYEVYLLGTVEEQDAGLIFEGTSASFTLPPGITKRFVPRDFESGQMDFVNEEYKEFAIKTGTMKDGFYTVCINAIDNNTLAQIGNHCLYLPLKRMMPPELLYPMNDSEVFEPFPVFMWLPPMPLSINFTYGIRIVEIMGDQIPIEAIDSNPAFFVQGNISGTSFQLPVYANPFEFGERYAWQILAYDNSGDLQIVASEVWGFNFENIEIITPPGSIAPDCELFSVEFRKEVINDSLFYKLSIINNDTLASTELLPYSFSISTRNDSIIAFNRKLATTWEQNPVSVNTPVDKINWKHKSGLIPNGKTYIGNIVLQDEPENSFWVIYSWNDKDGKVICKDSIAFNQTLCYHTLSLQLPKGFVSIHDSLLNIRFVNNYAPSKTIYVGIYDAMTMELAGRLTIENLTENDPGFFVAHGLNQLTINLDNFDLQADKVYLLTLYDIKNIHYLKFKTNYNHEEY